MLCLAVASCGGSAGPSNQPLLDTSAGPATKPLFNSNPIIIEDAISYYSHACNDPSFQFLIPLNQKRINPEAKSFACHRGNANEYERQSARHHYYNSLQVCILALQIRAL